MTRPCLQRNLLLGAALTASMALCGSALAQPRNHQTPMAAPAGANRSDADDYSWNMNSNGPQSADRDTGLDRARDRMSEEGLEHSQAQARNRDADDRNRDNDDRFARADQDRDKDVDRDKDRDKDRDADRDKDRDRDYPR